MKIFNGVNKKISTPVAIIIILACAVLVAGLTIWQYLNILEKKEVFEIEPIKEKLLEKETIEDSISNVEIILKESISDYGRIIIFVKDLESNKEEMCVIFNKEDIYRTGIKLEGVHLDHVEFRNGNLFLVKTRDQNDFLMRYPCGKKEGEIIYYLNPIGIESAKGEIINFLISPDGNFVAIDGVVRGIPTKRKLLLVNLNTKEEINLFSLEFVADELLSRHDELAKEGNPSLFSYWLRQWSLNSEEFWGFVDMELTGWPVDGSIFKINVKNRKIEKFYLPFCNYPTSCTFYNDDLNTENEMVVVGVATSVDDEISIYIYNIRSKQQQKIISYSKEITEKYYKEIGDYRYHGGVKPQFLNPRWENNDTISYTDLLSKERVIKKIELE